MTASIWLKIFLFYTIITSAISVVITCEYEEEEFESLGTFYTCIFEDYISISSENTTVSFTGSHYNSSFTDDDVKAFKTDFHKMIYFPKSIELKFKNLEAIYLNDGTLSKISQSDLKPFPKLKFLDLFENRLEIIEIDLFKFNLQLQVIWLSHNRIFEIHPNVFDHLQQLHTLYLSGNPCIGRSIRENRTEILNLIAEVKQKCEPGTVTTTISSIQRRNQNISENDLELYQSEKIMKEFEEELFKMVKEGSVMEGRIGKYTSEIEKLKNSAGKLEAIVYLLSILVVLMGLLIFVGYRKYSIGTTGIIPTVSMQALVV